MFVFWETLLQTRANRWISKKKIIKKKGVEREREKGGQRSGEERRGLWSNKFEKPVYEILW